MTEIPLPALEGSNPLGYLAALGVLDALSAATPAVTLKWTDELVPSAVIEGFGGDPDELLDMLDRDRQEWTTSPLLSFPPDAPVLTDAKPAEKQLRDWFEFVSGPNGNEAAADHLCAIVAENTFDGGGGRAKPTHLHFTAGQQQWLRMARELAAGVDRDRLREAAFGPWRYDSALPSLSWDSRGERVYALRGMNPSSEKRLGVPGADWLAFRGLVFYPVTRINGSLRTTACDTAWKSGAFRWPLWRVPVTCRVARSLVADRSLVAKDARLRPGDLEARGIISVRESKIRRTDQGGYGSFAASASLSDARGGQ
jgi:hypothetical protein